MKILNYPLNCKNIIVTINIGENYYNNWFKYAFPSWNEYCNNNEIGLVSIVSEIPNPNPTGPEHLMWQKFLIGKHLKEQLDFTGNACYLDSDFLINPFAPNIFNHYNPKTIGLVSQKKNIPYPLYDVLKRIAFFRNRYLSSNYPLDSFLFSSVNEIFERHNLSIDTDDFACAGLFVFNVKEHWRFFYESFLKYPKDQATLDGGSDEVHMNYEILSKQKVTWLDYRFQALWVYEMPWKYPFLYINENFNNEILIKQCVEASLFSNYFLHFAGSWEGNMWKVKDIANSRETLDTYSKLVNYLKVKPTGRPVGIVRPNN